MTIKFNKIRKHYKDKILIKEFTNFVGNAEKIGIFGENGSGKTTLLNLIIKNDLPQQGSIYFEPEISFSDIAYFAPDDLLIDEDYNDKDKNLYEKLSMGQKTRKRLEELFEGNYKIYLLDEPTNHLDEANKNWLIENIKSTNKNFFIASHDTAFLNQVVNKIWHMNNERIDIFRGGYDKFAIQKTEKDIELNKTFKLIKKKITDLRESDMKRQDHWTMMKKLKKIDPVKLHRKDQKFKQQNRVYKNRIRRLIDKDLPDLPAEKREFLLNLLNNENYTSNIISVEHLSKSFGRHTVLADINFEVEPQEKILITGKNGAGKTTLLKLIGKLERDFEGEIKYEDGLHMEYFTQENFEGLTYNLTLKEEIIKYVLENQGLTVRLADYNPEHPNRDRILNPHNVSPDMIYEHISQVEFNEDDLNRNVETFSEGEKVKLRLAKLLLKEPDIILFDEPTNHLDIRAKSGVMKGISKFTGAILVVTHDRELIEKISWDDRIDL